VTLLLAACSGKRGAATPAYPHAGEAIGTVRQSYDGALSDSLAVQTFRNIDRLFPSRIIRHGTPRPLPRAARELGEVTFTHNGVTHSLDDYLRLNRIAGFLVLHDGGIAKEWYGMGNTPETRWMSMSVAKSITSTLVGAALHEGAIGSVDESVTRYVKALAGSAYEGVTIRDVLQMASGVRWDETYTNPASDRRQLLEAQIAQRPGAAMALMAKLPRAAAPGTRHNYSTGETQVVGEVVRGAVRRDLADYLSERIWQRMGMEHDATWWLDSPGGAEIGGSGIAATLRDYGRFGQFVLDDGVVDGVRILPEGWVRASGQRSRIRTGEEIEYGYLWWPGWTEGARRDGAFAAVGIHGQYIYINPVARVVIVVWGGQGRPVGGAVVDDMGVFDAVVGGLGLGG